MGNTSNILPPLMSFEPGVSVTPDDLLVGSRRAGLSDCCGESEGKGFDAH